MLIFQSKSSMLLLKLLLCGAVVLLQCQFSVASGSRRIDDELNKLDAVIATRHTLQAGKRARVEKLMREMQKEATDKGRFQKCYLLFEEYRVYSCDSAVKYGNRSLELAEKLGDYGDVATVKLAISAVLASAGMYNEALSVLGSVNVHMLNRELRAEYYHRQEQAYVNLGMYVNDSTYAPQYYCKGGLYRDSLLQILPKSNPEYYNTLGRKWIAAGDWARAERDMLAYFSHQKQNTRQYAIAASSLAHIYKSMGNIDEAEYYYILAATSDINSLVLENEALRKLSVILLQKGDIERSYRYIQVAQDDAVRFNARLRRIENGEMLPVINAAYENKMEKQRTVLRNFLIIMGLLAAVLAVAVYLIARQMIALRKARKEVEEVNASLVALNGQLKEANCIKEEYVGHFLNLCSVYIGKLEKYQKAIHKKAASGNIEEVMVMTKSTRLVDYELKEFYRNFDATFLTLFPHFVERFNSLLADGEAIIPKNDELLNTELRIFALIRLGISDSSQIAKFLRYSVNTVYTYRAKVKAKAKIARDDFEQEVIKIDSLS